MILRQLVDLAEIITLSLLLQLSGDGAQINVGFCF